MYAENWKCDRLAIFYSRKYDISWIMLKVRECLWAGRIFFPNTVRLHGTITLCVYVCIYSLCMPWWRARQRQQTLFISAFLQFIRIQLNRCISFAIQPFLVRSYHFGMRLCRCVCVCARVLYVCIHFKQFLSDMHVVFFFVLMLLLLLTPLARI